MWQHLAAKTNCSKLFFYLIDNFFHKTALKQLIFLMGFDKFCSKVLFLPREPLESKIFEESSKFCSLRQKSLLK